MGVCLCFPDSVFPLKVSSGKKDREGLEIKAYKGIKTLVGNILCSFPCCFIILSPDLGRLLSCLKRLDVVCKLLPLLSI